MKTLFTLLIVMAMAGFALADVIDYGWEDGGTTLGIYPDPDEPSIIATNVTVADGGQVYAGMASLQLEDNLASGTPQAFVALLWNLQDGDEILVNFKRYDDTPGSAPSCRIWGHWNDDLPGDPYGYSGSASGQSDYGPGEGWDTAEFLWTVTDGHTGLVVECRTYSSPGDIVWIDDLHIEAPDHVYVQVPGSGPVGIENTTLSGVKSLFE